MTTALGLDPDAALEIASHRLLSLDTGDIAVLADRSTGWCVLDRGAYGAVVDYLDGMARTLRGAEPGADAVLTQLWEAGLLLAEGRPHPETVPRRHVYPNALLLKLTGACNFDCSYCYDYDERRFKARLGFDAIQRTIDALVDRQPSLAVVFHGGEPLLRFKLLKETVDYARAAAGDRCAIGFSVQTNASRFTDEIVEYLRENEISVGISLDGFDEDANRLRIVRKGPTPLQHFEALLERHPDFVREQCGVLAVVSRTSARTLHDFAIWLQDRGVTGFSLSFLDLAGRARDLEDERLSPAEAVDIYRRFVELIRGGVIDRLALKSLTGRINNLFTFDSRDLCHRGPCGAGDDFLVLDAEGRQRTCDCVYDPFFELGDSPEVAANDEAPARLRVIDRHDWLRTDGPTCSTCPLFGLCGGTCVAKAIAHHGTSRSVDPVECAISQYLYPELLNEFASGGDTPLLDYYARHRSDGLELFSELRD